MDRIRWRTRATSANRRSWSRRARRLIVTAFALWWFAAAAGLAGAQDVPPFEITVDHQTALFQLTGLLPGAVPPRCLVVEVHNGQSDAVVVSADVSGTLGSYLSLQIDAGDAVDPSTCVGFTGSSVFTGTVAQLGVSHGDPTSGISVPLTDRTRVVLRFSFAVADDNAAQGRTAAIRFDFGAQALPTEVVPTTTIPATTSIAPTTEASTSTSSTTTTIAETTSLAPTTTSAPTPTDPPTRTTRVQGVPATTAAPPETSAPSVVVIEPEAKPSPSLATRATEAVKTAVKVATKAAAVTARTGIVPGAFSTVVLGFLLFQARIDRNDPKLTSAPLEPEPDLEFTPRLGDSAL